MAWTSKLGNGRETGYSKHVAPSDLDAHWSWMVAGQNAVIDDQQNAYVENNPVISRVDRNGYVVWNKPIGTQGGRKNVVPPDLPKGAEGIASSGLALLDGALYFATPQGHAVALHLETGDAKWAAKPAEASIPDGWTIVARNGTVILVGRDEQPTEYDGQNNMVYGLAASNGKLLWKYRVQVALLSCAPALLDHAVIFQSQPATVECLSLKDGSVQWQHKGEFSPGTTGGVGVSEALGLAFVASNRKGKRIWNMPFGGNGVVRAFKIPDGALAWEQPFDFEANTVPAVAPVGPGRQPLVILSLGANVGPAMPESARLGDSWMGKIVALDAKTGALVWTYRLPGLPGHGPSGQSGSGLRSTFTSNVVCGGDGSVYFGTAHGLVWVLDGATGKRKSALQTPHLVGNPAVVGPGMLILGLKTAMGYMATCWRSDDGLCPTQVLRPLAKPLSETGTEHFWPVKQGADLSHPCKAGPFISAPRHLGKDPSWTFQFDSPEITRFYKRSKMDFTHKTPVIDSQGNIYIETHLGPIWIVRPDGELRGFLRLGHSLANPALHGRYLYAAEGSGWAHCVDIETLKIKWSTKYAGNGTPDSWNVTVADPPGVVLVMGEGDPPRKMTALRIDNGEKVWTYAVQGNVYNFLPSVWVDKGIFIFCDSGGGMYCLRLRDGSEVWTNTQQENKESFSTGFCVGAPNGLVYHTYNKGPNSVYTRMKGNLCGGVGVVKAWDRDTGEVRWTVEYDGLEGNNAPMMVEKPDGSGSILVVPLGSNADWGPDQEPYEWVGRIVGLDGDTGKELWAWDPPMWKWPGAKGPHMLDDGEFYNPDSWSNPPVLGADGTMYCQWHDGTIYAFSPFTGEVYSQWTLPDCGESGIPVIGPGLLACPGGYGLKVFRDLELERLWREAAEEAGDPRAFELGPAGELQGDGLTQGKEGCWGECKACYLDFTWEILEAMSEESHKMWEAMLAQQKAEREAKAKAKAKAKAGAKAAAVAPAEPRWLVVGGKTSGGITVKKAKDLKSAELGRLSTGALVEQVALDGERLHYKKLTGDGPDVGWVSLSFKGNELVKRQDA